eukprot:CAMPEP_0184552932 /NCGR_PEP_ID=MMETSP0199_2-20130426/30440_1 /TAXON_ID=1112570 /ORGANISM="Thraustochytrium sp., Strain LLF1b" /LENGTH=46 /DNA_ID= /DNA_START= /DNA_END= /DNA_ORIENTATION=
MTASTLLWKGFFQSERKLFIAPTMAPVMVPLATLVPRMGDVDRTLW